MSSRKQYFTLIHGEKVHAAPKSKVIPAKEFSSLLSGRDMLRKVKKDAEEYTQEVAEEAEQVKENAQREGFEEGFRQWAEQLSFLEQEKEKVRGELEDLVIPVALTAAKKILGREISLSKDAIVDIVQSNLKAVSQHKRIKVIVNPQDRLELEKNKEKLKKNFESLESFKFEAREDIESGGCIIETDGGIINAQLENRWEILEQAFEAMRIEQQQKKKAASAKKK